MLDLTFLSVEQIFGDNRLDIFKNYETECAITDFAILLGGYVSSIICISYSSEKNILMKAGFWSTKSYDVCNDVLVVDSHGDRSWHDVARRNGGARPALPYSSISKISSNVVRGANGIKEIEYGEYPQWVVDENYSSELESAYNNGNMKTTSKNYTTDSVSCSDTDTSFRTRTHTEYEYKGNKYIRFVGDSNSEVKFLSDGRKIKTGQVYWVRVEPITWLVDEKNDIALSKYILFSGVQFKNRSDYKGNFENTDIKQFMDKYFSKEIITMNNILTTSPTRNSSNDIDSIFEEAINRMNEINSKAKTKILK